MDFSALIRRDHDDLDAALVAMVATATPIDELANLLDIARLALAVHVVAEATVLEPLAIDPASLVLRRRIAQTRDEHREQQAALDRLAQTRPGSEAWYAQALELRIQVLDHASRAELIRWVLDDHLTAPRGRALAGAYATERMRVLSRTSPLTLAAERVA